MLQEIGFAIRQKLVSSETVRVTQPLIVSVPTIRLIASARCIFDHFIDMLFYPVRFLSATELLPFDPRSERRYGGQQGEEDTGRSLAPGEPVDRENEAYSAHQGYGYEEAVAQLTARGGPREAACWYTCGRPRWRRRRGW